jgi:hypothetical protein
MPPVGFDAPVTSAVTSAYSVAAAAVAAATNAETIISAAVTDIPAPSHLSTNIVII